MASSIYPHAAAVAQASWQHHTTATHLTLPRPSDTYNRFSKQKWLLCGVVQAEATPLLMQQQFPPTHPHFPPPVHPSSLESNLYKSTHLQQTLPHTTTLHASCQQQQRHRHTLPPTLTTSLTTQKLPAWLQLPTSLVGQQRLVLAARPRRLKLLMPQSQPQRQRQQCCPPLLLWERPLLLLHHPQRLLLLPLHQAPPCCLQDATQT